jgi:predicted nucleotidyltransferase
MVSAGNKKGLLLPKKSILSNPELASLIYHDIFDYPMTKKELKKWKFEPETKIKKQIKVRKIGQYYILDNREGLVSKRKTRHLLSQRKIQLARSAARVLGRIPSIKMVAITGALAMQNAGPSSDIDFLIITARGTLWTSRLLVYAILDFAGIPRRKYGIKRQKDRLCLNMWLDEADLAWDEADRNLYTAHEIAQIAPLVNKDKTYERLMKANGWASYYWPNAVRIPKKSFRITPKKFFLLYLLEPLARGFQLWYMKKKITREVVTPTRAIFHPRDWGKIVALKLAGRLN